MKKFRNYIVLITSIALIFCSLTCCSQNKEESGNKIKVDNIHKGSGKFDRDTLYISASNVDTSINSSIVKQDILNVGIKSLSNKCFNPYFIESKSDLYVVDSIWEPLMKKGYDGEFYPNLLKQLPTVSEDKTTYLFSLREDILWEDGTKLTTRDINFTFKFLMDSNYLGNFDREFLNMRGWREYRDGIVNYVSGLEILDDYNFKVFVDKPSIYTIDLLNIYPLAYSYYGQYYYQGGSNLLNNIEINPFGNGVFKFLGYAEGEYLILEKNNFYFKGMSSINTLTYKIIDEKKFVNDLVQGNIDITRDVFLDDKNIIDTSKAQFLNGYIFDNYEYASIGINHTNELLKDVSIRKAINLCIDKNEIVKNKLNGNFNVIDVPIDGNFYRFFYDKDNVKKNYDKSSSIKILSDLGWMKNKEGICEKDGKKLEFRILVQMDNSAIEQIFPIIEKNLKSVGISLVVDKIQLDNFGDILSRKYNYDLFLVSPSFTFDMNWIKSFYTGSIDNYYFYSNPALDEFLKAISTTYDIEQSKTYYNQVYEILKEDLPIIPLFQNKQFDVYNGRILGINSVNVFKTFYYDEIILKK